MTILFINSIGKGKWGGGEKWIINTAKGLQDKGHTVIIGCRKNSILSKNTQKKDLPVFHITNYTDFSFYNIFKISKFINNNNVDVIISSLNRDVRLAGLAALMHKNTVVIGRQGVQLIKKKWKYKKTFQWLTDGIITNSQSLKTVYDSYGWWDTSFVKVIYNGIKSVSKENEDFNYSQITTITDNTKIILSAGRLSKQKGFTYLIDAAKIAKEKGKNWRFFIAGKGKLEKQLQDQIAKHNLNDYVFLIGFVDSLADLLNKADLFVLPSLYEGMPNVLLEAMISGTPVVSTPVNGSSELITEGITGCFIPVKESQSIYDKIDYCFSDWLETTKRAERARDFIKQNFTESAVIENLEHYLFSLNSNKK